MPGADKAFGRRYPADLPFLPPGSLPSGQRGNSGVCRWTGGEHGIHWQLRGRMIEKPSDAVGHH